MALTHEEVKRVALLARLELEEEEIGLQMEHINRLMACFEALQSLDVQGVEPTAHSIPLQNVMREDEARPSFPRAEMLRNAPEQRDGLIIVPRIVGG